MPHLCCGIIPPMTSRHRFAFALAVPALLLDRLGLQPGAGQTGRVHARAGRRRAAAAAVGRSRLRDQRNLGRPDDHQRRHAGRDGHGAARQAPARHPAEPGRQVAVRRAQRIAAGRAGRRSEDAAAAGPQRRRHRRSRRRHLQAEARHPRRRRSRAARRQRRRHAPLRRQRRHRDPERRRPRVRARWSRRSRSARSRRA